MRDPNDGGEGKVRATNYRAAPTASNSQSAPARSKIIQSRQYKAMRTCWDLSFEYFTSLTSHPVVMFRGVPSGQKTVAAMDAI